MDTSWDLLDAGLKIIFSRHDIEFDDIAQIKRLEYKDMEYILYHLFLIIDPRSTRRIFHSIFPAKNQDDTTMFITNMVIMINKQQLPLEKTSAPRLRMCGGTPFRNLIGAIIKKAAEVDMFTRMKRFKLARPSEVDSDLESRIIKDKENLERVMNDLDANRYKLANLTRLLQKLQSKKQTIWSQLPDCKPDLNFDKQSLKEKQNSLMPVLTSTTQAFRVALNKLATVDIPEPTIEAKRLSYYVRELQTQMNSSFGIVEYSDQMDRLISKLEEKQRLSEEELLKDPKFIRRYQDIASLIPLIPIKPIKW